ncbi:MAG: Holliday junction resolvase RuvX [Phycisphaerales bacterium]|nr:Holliday junction resolvase RuvX [Phycisphaerales bacterium]
MTRYLAIDLGDKRTGLAVGDDFTAVVAPLTVLEVPIAERAGEALLDTLARAVADQFSTSSPAELVIGLPLNMDGTEGRRAKLVREFAARLESRLTPRRTIHFFDERLTSVEADWQMAQSGRTHGQKKKTRDALAAAVLLRGFLASREKA